MTDEELYIQWATEHQSQYAATAIAKDAFLAGLRIGRQQGMERCENIIANYPEWIGHNAKREICAAIRAAKEE